MKLIYVLMWTYSDNSATKVIKVYVDKDEANRNLQTMVEHGDEGKKYYIEVSIIKEYMDKPKLQLNEKDGNAFAIIGTAKRVAAKWNRDNPENIVDIDEVQREALEGDYDHVIQTMMKYFNIS